MANCVEDSNNDIEIIYERNENKDNKTRIFGENFVVNNNFKIIYKDQEYELTEYFEDIYNIKDNKDNNINLRLRTINTVTNLSHMFYRCDTLLSFPEISEDINYSNITEKNKKSSEMDSSSNILSESEINEIKKYIKFCENNKSIDINKELDVNSKTNNSNSNSENSIFKTRNSLGTLNTKNVTNMSYMFGECNSLKSLPNISK